MVFSTPIFLFVFLPLFAAAYALFPWKNTVLLAASLIFYAWGEPVFVFFIVLITLINFLFGRWLAGDSPHRFRFLTVAVALDVLVLIVFKYAGFIVENLNPVLAAVKLGPIPPPHIPLPLGISFFIFHAITYVVDIYRRHSTPARNFPDALLYMLLFPQLVAGPIVRYEEIGDRIRSRTTDWLRLLSGTELFIIGLAKKVILADSLAVPADRIFSLPTNELTFGIAWLGVICFSLQIFFDFSGYTDMAIGIGRAMGFDLPQNFNQPYRSRSIQEFWRRWHMTLSRWFRDYVYIPLGGNRKGPFRTYVNLLGVFVLTGFWHGASWNFLIWGLIHGLFITLERFRLGDWLKRTWAPLAHGYLLLVVVVAWVFFRAHDLPTALAFLKTMVGFTTPVFATSIGEFVNPYVATVLILALVVSFWPEGRRWTDRGPERAPATYLRLAALGLMALVSFSFVASYTHKAFIYFRF